MYVYVGVLTIQQVCSGYRIIYFKFMFLCISFIYVFMFFVDNVKSFVVGMAIDISISFSIVHFLEYLITQSNSYLNIFLWKILYIVNFHYYP